MNEVLTAPSRGANRVAQRAGMPLCPTVATQVSEVVKRATAKTQSISSKQNNCPASKKRNVWSLPNWKTTRVEHTEEAFLCTQPRAYLGDKTHTCFTNGHPGKKAEL